MVVEVVEVKKVNFKNSIRVVCPKCGGVGTISVKTHRMTGTIYAIVHREGKHTHYCYVSKNSPYWYEIDELYRKYQINQDITEVRINKLRRILTKQLNRILKETLPNTVKTIPSTKLLPLLNHHNNDNTTTTLHLTLSCEFRICNTKDGLKLQLVNTVCDIQPVVNTMGGKNERCDY